jgi:hypothetical protein
MGIHENEDRQQSGEESARSITDYGCGVSLFPHERERNGWLDSLIKDEARLWVLDSIKMLFFTIFYYFLLFIAIFF